MATHDAKQMRRLICFALVMVTVVVYWRVGGFEFINFDDPDYVTENEFVRQGLTWKGIVWAFTSAYASNWHPLTWISHMMDVQVFGLHAGGHHFVSVLFHAANAVLLFLWLQRLTGAQWRSAIVAGLFAWHPLHVESVAWISERKDVLSTFFGLLSLLAYTAWVRQKWKPGKMLALLCFVLGLLSKPMLVTLPFVLLLLDFWPLQRVENLGWRTFFAADFRRLAWEKWPWFALTAISSVATFFAQKAGGAVVTVASYPLPGRVANALVSYCLYAGKRFWPARLSIFYPYSHYREPGLVALGAAAVLVLISMLALASTRRRPYLLFGWLWFLGTLVPVIGLVQVGSQSMADRYTYLPLIGLFIALVWWWHELAAGLKWKTLLGGLGAGLALAFCLKCTAAQVRHWRSSVTLFSHALAVTERNAVANHNLGFAYFERGQTADALRAYGEALRLDSSVGLFHNNIALAWSAAGNYDEAFRHFTLAEQLDAKNVKFKNNFGNALMRVGSPEKALLQFQTAVRQETNYAEAYNGAGAALNALGRYDEGVTNLLQALKIATNYAEAYNNLGGAFAKQKKNAEAIPYYEKSLRLNPTNASVHYNLGLALDKVGRVEEAFAQFGKAVETDTNSVEARYQYGRGLFVRGQVINAISQLSEAVRLKTDHAQAQLYLGLAYFEYGRTEASLEHLQIAGRLLPDSVEALNARAWVLATTESDAFRNGAEAVQFAEKAATLSEHKSAAVLHTLAAAYAATERFDEALALYRAKRPLRHEAAKP